MKNPAYGRQKTVSVHPDVALMPKKIFTFLLSQHLQLFYESVCCPLAMQFISNVPTNAPPPQKILSSRSKNFFGINATPGRTERVFVSHMRGFSIYFTQK